MPQKLAVDIVDRPIVDNRHTDFGTGDLFESQHRFGQPDQAAAVDGQQPLPIGDAD
jgi:hypothetical protein